MSAHCNDCGTDLVYGTGEDWQLMTCPVCSVRAERAALAARVETLTAEREKAHQWLIEHMADPDDDDDDDFARLLERLFRFGDQGWGEAGRQTSRADAAEARVETLENVTEFMWTVVCNVSEGDWDRQRPEWQEAAARVREQWHAYLASRPAGEETRG